MAELGVAPETLALVLVLLCAVCWIARACAGHRRADARADALLRAVLSPGEYAQLSVRGYLEVASRARPGRVYRIPAGDEPVVVYDAGTRSALLCLKPVDALPRGDVVLAHKLLLEAAEQEYWRLANVLWGLRTPSRDDIAWAHRIDGGRGV